MINVVAECDEILAEKLDQLEKKIFTTSPGGDRIWVAINMQDYIYWVKKKENKLIGYLATRREGDIIHIIGIGILEKYRGSGYASSLMESMIEYFLSTEIKGIYLETRVSNKVAKGLYDKFNFTLIETRKNFYSQPPGPEDAHVFALNIQK